MNNSKINNKTDITKSKHISDGKLSEKYNLLQKEHDNLLSKHDAIKQELHDTKRDYEIDRVIQRHLIAQLNEKYKTLNIKYNRIKKWSETLTSSHRINNIDSLLYALTRAISEEKKVKAELDVSRAETDSCQLQVEELITEIDEMQAKAESWKMRLIESLVREADTLGEVNKAHELLGQKGSQNVQAQVARMKSINVEFKDKRQEMEQKQTNSKFRKNLAETQATLEALIHEKHTKWNQQACEVAHHNETLIKEYKNHITQLERMCEKQKKELCCWYNNVKNSNMCTKYLPDIISLSLNECDKLRDKACHYSATKLANALQIRELLQQIASLSDDKNSSSVN